MCWWVSPAVLNISPACVSPATLRAFIEGVPPRLVQEARSEVGRCLCVRVPICVFCSASAFALRLPRCVGENGDPRPFVLSVVEPPWFCFILGLCPNGSQRNVSG